MTETAFYNELRFETSIKEEEKLLVSDIADAVEHIISMRKGAVVSDYTIRSLNFGISKKKAMTSCQGCVMSEYRLIVRIVGSFVSDSWI